MLLTPNPKTGAMIIANDNISFNNPQSSSEFSNARGSTIIVFIAPATNPIKILIVFEYACLLTKPKEL